MYLISSCQKIAIYRVKSVKIILFPFFFACSKKKQKKQEKTKFPPALEIYFSFFDFVN